MIITIILEEILLRRNKMDPNHDCKKCEICKNCGCFGICECGDCQFRAVISRTAFIVMIIAIVKLFLMIFAF